MKMKTIRMIAALGVSAFPFCASAIGLTDAPAALPADADAICVATVINNTVFEKEPHRRIFTATGFSVSESLKGVLGNTVRVEHRGGAVNGRGEQYCGRPEFDTDTTYLLFLRRRDDGTLYCLHQIAESDSAYEGVLDDLRLQAEALSGTGQDLSDQQASLMAAMNLLPGSTGMYSSRFIAGDRGDPIEYVVDMDFLPAGITSNQALIAVSNAFAAWSEVTTLTFRFGGVESFGVAAPDVNAGDGRIYIQLHDHYGIIDPSSTLAVGGRAYSYNSSLPGIGLGGRVDTNEFDVSTEGFLVMEHSKVSLSTLSNFEEVLCHEIGHVLSMDHSSEDGGETDPLLYDATMYYQAHFDGRGAALREWDTNTVHIAYPFDNTPPYGYDRVIRAVSSPNPQAPLSSGVNQAEVRCYDLQTSAALSMVSSTAINGAFTLENSNTVFYTPSGWYSDSEELSGNSYNDICYLRMSDGVNLSAVISVRVIQFFSDGNRDQLPNSWVAAHGISGGALGDHDNDTFTNLEEWLLDTDPEDPDSHLLIEMSDVGPFWNSRPLELYQIQSTTNLTEGFSDRGNPVLAGSTNEAVTVEYGDREFYRVQRLP